MTWPHGHLPGRIKGMGLDRWTPPATGKSKAQLGAISSPCRGETQCRIQAWTKPESGSVTPEQSLAGTGAITITTEKARLTLVGCPRYQACA
jgi:hypothetical protein